MKVRQGLAVPFQIVDESHGEIDGGASPMIIYGLDGNPVTPHLTPSINFVSNEMTDPQTQVTLLEAQGTDVEITRMTVRVSFGIGDIGSTISIGTDDDPEQVVSIAESPSPHL